MTSEIGRCRNHVDRDRHRTEVQVPLVLRARGTAGTITRIAPAVITMANTPA